MDVATRYARNGEVSIAYQVVGQGELDLLWVPGFASHVELYQAEPATRAFQRRLASFARLIVFDKRGTGLSDPVAGVPSLEERMEGPTGNRRVRRHPQHTGHRIDQD